MSGTNEFDRHLAVWMTETVASPPTPGRFERAIAATTHRRPLPRWRATVGSNWIGSATGAWLVPAPGRPRIRTLAAGAALVVVALVGVQALQGLGVGVPGSTPSPSPSPTVQNLAPQGIVWAWPDVPYDLNAQLHAPVVGSGLLAAGTHAYLDVDLQLFNLTFTVPAGWTWNGRFLSKGAFDQPDGAAIFFFGGPVEIYVDPCRWSSIGETHRLTVGLQARDLATLLAAQTGRNASRPLELRPNADQYHHATGLALSVPEVDFAACDGGEYRSWGPETNARSHQGPGQRDVVWIVDVNGGSVAGRPNAPGGLIVDAAWFASTPDAVVAEMREIMRSLYVGHWG